MEHLYLYRSWFSNESNVSKGSDIYFTYAWTCLFQDTQWRIPQSISHPVPTVCKRWRTAVDRLVEHCRHANREHLQADSSPTSDLHLALLVREHPGLTALRAPSLHSDTDLRIVGERSLPEGKHWVEDCRWEQGCRSETRKVGLWARSSLQEWNSRSIHFGKRPPQDGGPLEEIAYCIGESLPSEVKQWAEDSRWRELCGSKTLNVWLWARGSLPKLKQRANIDVEKWLSEVKHWK